LDVLEQAFFNETGITVRHVAMGSGQALAMAKAGRVDVVLTHAPVLEEEFMRKGWGAIRLPVMRNDFIIAGPPDDPAGIARANSAVAAFTAIAGGKRIFISRDDQSGTHLCELALWEKAGIQPAGLPWYQSAQSMWGNYGVLRMAAETGGYALADMASFVTAEAGEGVVVLNSGDSALENIFSVIPVSRSKAAVNQESAEVFAHWLTTEARTLIAEFGCRQFGVPLFRPA
jgi:tungstate transport system substrate-binding protein